jgi:hypothetical protein
MSECSESKEVLAIKWADTFITPLHVPLWAWGLHAGSELQLHSSQSHMDSIPPPEAHMFLILCVRTLSNMIWNHEKSSQIRDNFWVDLVLINWGKCQDMGGIPKVPEGAIFSIVNQLCPQLGLYKHVLDSGFSAAYTICHPIPHTINWTQLKRCLLAPLNCPWELPKLWMT